MSKKEEIIRGYVEGLVEDERIAAEKYASAQPVYYGIWTCEDIVTQPGYEEGYGRFFETEEWGEGMTPREAFAWVVENAGVSDKDLEYAFFYKPPVTLAYLEEHDGVLPESVDDAEIVAFLSEKYGDVLDYLPLLHIGKVAPNAMFLTERSAQTLREERLPLLGGRAYICYERLAQSCSQGIPADVEGH